MKTDNLTVREDRATVTTESTDVMDIRKSIYLGQGFHIIRNFLNPAQVSHIAEFWAAHSNKLLSGFAKDKDCYSDCPDVSVRSGDVDRHYNFFWNQPRDMFSYCTAWRLQHLRNRIEGNPPNKDFLPLFPVYRVDHEHAYAASYRIVTTRTAGQVPIHIDHPLDYSRVQLALMLTSHGSDYRGGSYIYDKSHRGNRIDVCLDYQLSAGDLLVFRYSNQHGVDHVTTPPGGRGFSRLLMPLQIVEMRKAADFQQRTFAGKTKRLLGDMVRQVRRSGRRRAGVTRYDEAPFADGQQSYHSDDVLPLMQIAVREGFDPSEVFYHRGLWARFEAFREWQMTALLRHGLKQSDHFLDVGCGWLRLGMQLIPYLDENLYCGVDPVEGYLRLGECYMNEVVQCNKQYQLHGSSTFDFEHFGRRFDYAFAHSVFTHLSHQQIRQCFEALRKVMRPGGVFLFTYTAGIEEELPLVYAFNTPITMSSQSGPEFYDAVCQESDLLITHLPPDEHPTQRVCRVVF